jgi:hypothetical protein
MSQEFSTRDRHGRTPPGTGVSTQVGDDAIPKDERNGNGEPITTETPLEKSQMPPGVFHRNFLDRELAPLRKVYLKIIIPAVVLSVKSITWHSSFRVLKLIASPRSLKDMSLVLWGPVYLLGSTLECTSRWFELLLSM